MADIERARLLRKTETWAEKLIWKWLRDRRFSGYDSRLLRPVTMPILVRFALRLMKRWRRKAPARAAA